jgi:hypothetical protein
VTSPRTTVSPAHPHTENVCLMNHQRPVQPALQDDVALISIGQWVAAVPEDEGAGGVGEEGVAAFDFTIAQLFHFAQ